MNGVTKIPAISDYQSSYSSMETSKKCPPKTAYEMTTYRCNSELNINIKPKNQQAYAKQKYEILRNDV